MNWPRTIRVRGFGDSALDYELLVWVPSPLHDGRAIHGLNRDIYARLDAAGVEIPFPQREVRVLGDATPTLDSHEQTAEQGQRDAV